MSANPSQSILNGLNSRNHSPTPGPVPVSRMPSSQQQGTILSHHMVVTPASAKAISSGAPSPYSLSLQASPVPNGSHDATMQPPQPTPFELPESLMNGGEAFSSPGSRDGTSPHPNRVVALTRKVSTTARNGGRVLLRKPSTKAGLHSEARDTSLGPNTRRRSNSTKADSRTMTGAMYADVPDYELGDQEQRHLAQGLHGLGLYDAADRSVDLESPVSPVEQQGEAPTVPENLVKGLPMLKVTKKASPPKAQPAEVKDGKQKPDDDSLEAAKKSVKGRKRIRLFVDAGGQTISWTVLEKSFASRFQEKHFSIDDIKEIYTAEDAATYRQQYNSSEEEEGRWCTILYRVKDDRKTLNLVARSKEDLKFFVDSIQMMQKHRQELMMGLTGKDGLLNEKNIRFHWDREVKAAKVAGLTSTLEDGLNYSAIANLCKRLHIHLPKKTIQGQFDAADARSVGQLNYAEFKSFILSIEERQELRPIYDSIRGDDQEGMSLPQFFDFLTHTQGIDLQNTWPDYWDKRVYHRWVAMSHEMQSTKIQGGSLSVRPSRTNSGSNVKAAQSTIDNGIAVQDRKMDFVAFASFMMSPACFVYQQEYRSPVFDRPLNEYYISSSHNTYLTGKQVLGEASTEPYITALRTGCKCVEIDCWDGSQGQPKVTHNYTGTTSILFKDVVSTIGRYAFVHSMLPLTLSLEVHCNSQQQEKMAAIIEETLGEMVVLEPLKRGATSLPTPDELRGRILIKVKASGRTISEDRQAVQLLNGRERSLSSTMVGAGLSPEPVGTEMSHALASIQSPAAYFLDEALPRTSYDTTTSATTASVPPSVSGDESDNLVPPSALSKTKPTKITERLGKMGVYLQGHTFKNFDTASAHEYNHIFSLNESTANDLCRIPVHKGMFEDHNQQYMTRVYPKRDRISSTNFDPNIYWRRGVQMVALNWQHHDEYMQINQAMFASPSDQGGYVLKPEYLRQPRRFNGNSYNRLRLSKYKVKFSVEVISAQRLPKLPKMNSFGGVNPFVELQMFSAEDKTKGIATGTIKEDPKDSTDINSKATKVPSADAQRPHGIGFPYTAQTSVIIDNGYNPQWNKRIELALETKYPDLVFVRWIVWHSPTAAVPEGKKNCVQLATFTAKLGSLQEGYRHLPLYAHNGEEFIYSTLFCKIKKEKPEFAGVAE